MPIYISKPKSSGGSAWLQAKEITVGTTDQTVGPDPGYDGLSSILVHPTPLDNVHNAAGTPTTQAQTYIPDTGKHFGSFYVPGVQVDTTNNSATPTTSSQTKTPDSGKFFSSFTVGAIPTLSGNASESDVKSGKTFYGSDYTKKTGTFVGQEKSVEVGAGGSTTVLPDTGKYLTKVSVTGTAMQTQEKEATPNNNEQNITPDSGKVLSKVTVHKVPEDTTHNSATPTTSSQTITPDSGKWFKNFTVGAIELDTVHNYAVPSSSQQVITPDTGKYFNTFVVEPTPTAMLYAETKRATADSQTYLPDTGYDGFSQFTVLPQQHTSDVGYIPNPDDINDLGLYHNIRYVDTTDMIIPSGNKAITSNGTNIDVTDKKTVSVNVQPVIDNTNNVGTPMENSQTITPNTGEYFAQFHIDAIPSEYIIPSGNKEITANGTDIDVSSYATASVNVNTGLKRNTLWTNSSPSTSISEATNVTLSSIYSVYDYISIKYRPVASSTTTKEIIVPFKSFLNNRIVIGVYYAGTTGVDPYYHIRAIYPTSTTNIVIDKPYKTNGNQGEPTRLIPTEIAGLYT